MVMPNGDAKLGDAAGVGAAEGRRPTAVPTPAAATPELSDRPRRRTFSVQDKLRVLAEIDRAPAGGTGAILTGVVPVRPHSGPVPCGAPIALRANDRETS